MTFLALLVHVLVPVLVAGVISYLVNMPTAPFSLRAKSLSTWVIWVVTVLYILWWVLDAFGLLPAPAPIRGVR